MIKAIETVYNGYRFRSRLEARWAVFFDALGIEYQYEPEGFDLGEDGWYLPDFYLPNEKLYVEVKGENPDDDYSLKLKSFRDSVKGILLVVGDPFEYTATLFVFDLSDSSGGSSEYDTKIIAAFIGNNSRVKRLGFYIEAHNSSKTIFTSWENYIRHRLFISRNLDVAHGRIATSYGVEPVQHAAIKARQARFEHR